MSYENKSGPVRSSQDQFKYTLGRVKSGDDMIWSSQGQVMSGQVIWRQDRAGQIRLEQTESGHDNVWTGHVSSTSDQVRPGQSQVRTNVRTDVRSD